MEGCIVHTYVPPPGSAEPADVEAVLPTVTNAGSASPAAKQPTEATQHASLSSWLHLHSHGHGGQDHEDDSSSSDADDTLQLDEQPDIYPLSALNKRDPLVACVRLVYMAVFLAIIIASPFFVARIRVQHEYLALEAGTPIRLSIGGCDLTLGVNQLDYAELDITMGRTLASFGEAGRSVWLLPALQRALDSDQLDVQGTNITVLEGALERVSCSAKLSLSTSMPVDLEILGVDGRTLKVASTAPLDFGAHTVTISGTSVALSLSHLSAKKLTAFVGDRGQVIVNQMAANANVTVAPATADCPAGSTKDMCVSRGGDVFITMAPNGNVPTLVHAQQGDGVICLAAVNVVELSASNYTCASVATNDTQVVSQRSGLICEIDALLYSINGTSAAPAQYTLVLSANNGGVYVSMTPEEPIDTASYETANGGAFASGISLSASGQQALSQVVPWILEEPNTDAVVIIDLSAQNAGKWIFATRAVYLQLEPYWLGALSASMLMPRMQIIEARLDPGFCPLSALDIAANQQMDLFSTGQLADMLLTLISKPALATDPTLASTYVIAQNLDTGKYRYTVDPAGGYVASRVNITDNPVLLAAVIVSLIIAAIIALVGAGAVWFAASEAKLLFDQFLHRQEKVHTLGQVMEASNDDTADTGLEQPSIGAESYSRPWGYFPVVLFGYVYLKPKLRNSLDLFLAEQCRVRMPRAATGPIQYLKATISKAMGQEPPAPEPYKTEMTLAQFMEPYERFCASHGYLVKDPVDNAEYLRSKYGILVEEESVDVLQGVRFRHPHERAPTSVTIERYDGNVTKFFVATECVTSQLEADYIAREDFVAKVAGVAAKTGHATWEFVPTDVESIGIKLIPERTRTVVRGVKLQDHAHDGNHYEEPDTREPGWWVFEAALVAVHMIMAILPPIPVLYIAMWMQSVYQATTAFEVTEILTLDDLLYRPWMIFSKQLLIHNDVVFIIFFGIFVVTALVDLCFLYLHFPQDGLLSRFDTLLSGKLLGRDLSYSDVMKYLSKHPHLFPITFRRVQVETEHAEDDSDDDDGSSGSDSDSGRGCLSLCRKKPKRIGAAGNALGLANVPGLSLLADMPGMVASNVSVDFPGLAATKEEPNLTEAQARVQVLQQQEEVHVRSYASLESDKEILEFISRADRKQPLQVAHERSLLRRAVYAFRWFVSVLLPLMLMIIVCSYVGYVGLIAVWWLLGAILNPSRFLPIACATGTFITVITVRIKQAMELRKHGKEMVMSFVQDKIQALIASSPISDAGLMDEKVVSSVLSGDVSGAALALVATGPISGVLSQVHAARDALGVSQKTLMAIASGDPSAIIEMATTSLKMDPVLVKVIMAFARTSEAEMQVAIMDLVHKFAGAAERGRSGGGHDVKGLVGGLVDLMRSDEHTRQIAISRLLLAGRTFVDSSSLAPEVLEASVSAVLRRSEDTLLKLLTSALASMPNPPVPVALATLVSTLVACRNMSVADLLVEPSVHKELSTAVWAAAPATPDNVRQVMDGMSAVVRGEADDAADAISPVTNIPRDLIAALVGLARPEHHSARAAVDLLAGALGLPKEFEYIVSAFSAIRSESHLDLPAIAAATLEGMGISAAEITTVRQGQSFVSHSGQASGAAADTTGANSSAKPAAPPAESAPMLAPSKSQASRAGDPPSGQRDGEVESKSTAGSASDGDRQALQATSADVHTLIALTEATTKLQLAAEELSVAGIEAGRLAARVRAVEEVFQALGVSPERAGPVMEYLQLLAGDLDEKDMKGISIFNKFFSENGKDRSSAALCNFLLSAQNETWTKPLTTVLSIWNADDASALGSALAKGRGRTVAPSRFLKMITAFAVAEQSSDTAPFIHPQFSLPPGSLAPTDPVVVSRIQDLTPAAMTHSLVVGDWRALAAFVSALRPNKRTSKQVVALLYVGVRMAHAYKVKVDAQASNQQLDDAMKMRASMHIPHSFMEQAAAGLGIPQDAELLHLGLELTFGAPEAGLSRTWMLSAGISAPVVSAFRACMLEDRKRNEAADAALGKMCADVFDMPDLKELIVALRDVGTRMFIDGTHYDVIMGSLGDVFWGMSHALPDNDGRLAMIAGVLDVLSPIAEMRGKDWLHAVDTFIGHYHHTGTTPPLATQTTATGNRAGGRRATLVTGAANTAGAHASAAAPPVFQRMAALLDNLRPVLDLMAPDAEPHAAVSPILARVVGPDRLLATSHLAGENALAECRQRLTVLCDLILAQRGVNRFALPAGSTSARRALMVEEYSSELAAVLHALELQLPAEYVVGADAAYFQLLVARAAKDDSKFRKALLTLGSKMDIREAHALVGVVFGDKRFLGEVSDLATAMQIPVKLAQGIIGISTGADAYLEAGADVLATKLGLGSSTLLTALVKTIRGQADEQALKPLAKALELPSSIVMALVGSGSEEQFLKVIRGRFGLFRLLNLPRQLYQVVEVFASLAHGSREALNKHWGFDELLPLLTAVPTLAKATTLQTWRKTLRVFLERMVRLGMLDSQTGPRSILPAVCSEAGAAAIVDLAQRMECASEQVVVALFDEIAVLCDTDINVGRTLVQELMTSEDPQVKSTVVQFDSTFEPDDPEEVKKDTPEGRDQLKLDEIQQLQQWMFQADQPSPACHDIIAMLCLSTCRPLRLSEIPKIFSSGDDEEAKFVGMKRYALAYLLSPFRPAGEDEQADEIDDLMQAAPRVDDGPSVNAVNEWMQRWESSGCIPGDLVVFLLAEDISEGLFVSPAQASALWLIVLMNKPLCHDSFNTQEMATLVKGRRNLPTARALHTLSHLRPDTRDRVSEVADDLAELAVSLKINPEVLTLFVRFALGDPMAVKEVANEYLHEKLESVKMLLAACMPLGSVQFPTSAGSGEGQNRRRVFVEAALGSRDALLRLGMLLFLEDSTVLDTTGPTPTFAQQLVASTATEAKPKLRAVRSMSRRSLSTSALVATDKSEVWLRQTVFTDQLNAYRQKLHAETIQREVEGADTPLEKEKLLRCANLLRLVAAVMGDQDDEGGWSSAFIERDVKCLIECLRLPEAVASSLQGAMQIIQDDDAGLDPLLPALTPAGMDDRQARAMARFFLTIGAASRNTRARFSEPARKFAQAGLNLGPRTVSRSQQAHEEFKHDGDVSPATVEGLHLLVKELLVAIRQPHRVETVTRDVLALPIDQAPSTMDTSTLFRIAKIAEACVPAKCSGLPTTVMTFLEMTYRPTLTADVDKLSGFFSTVESFARAKYPEVPAGLCRFLVDALFGKVGRRSFARLADASDAPILIGVERPQLALLGEVCFLATTVSRWKGRGGLHPLQSLKGSTATVLDMLSTRKSAGGRAFVAIPELVRTLATDNGLASDDLERVVDACQTMLDGIAGDYAGTVKELTDLSMSAQSNMQWVPEGFQHVLAGDASKIYNKIDDICTKVIRGVIPEAMAAEAVQALLQLVAGIVQTLHDVKSPAERKRRLQSMAAQLVPSALRRLLPPDMADVSLVISGIFSLIGGDIAGLKPLALRFGDFDEEKLNTLVSTVQSVVSHVNGEGMHTNDKKHRKRQEIAGSSTPAALFERFDADGSGTLDFNEFMELTRHMHLHLNPERAKALFAMADSDGSMMLEADEFEKTLKLLEEEVGNSALDIMGLSRTKLVAAVTVVAVTLILVFVFIFLGIMTLTTGSSFGSVVNSLLPMSAGGAMASGGGDKPDDAESQDEEDNPFAQAVKSAMESFQPHE